MIGTVGIFLLGPSKILFLPDSQYLLYLGLAITGVSISFIFVPLLPEIIYVVGTAENIKKDTTFNDKASGVYNFSYALGTIIAPNLGGVLAQYLKFRYMCDFMAVFALLFAIVFFVTNVGF